MLTMRPHWRAFMPGTAARMVWNEDDRLMAMTASHFSTGKSSILATCWMPALLTSTSSAPNSFSVARIMSAISAGLPTAGGGEPDPRGGAGDQRSFAFEHGCPRVLTAAKWPVKRVWNRGRNLPLFLLRCNIYVRAFAIHGTKR